MINICENEKFSRALHTYPTLENNCVFWCSAWEAVGEAGCFVMLQKLCASGWPWQPGHKRTGLLPLLEKQWRYQPKQWHLLFSFSSSLLSLGTWDEVPVCAGACVAGGGLGLPCALSWIEVLEGTFCLCARGVCGFGYDRYILVLGWPCRENKESATPKA